MIVWWMLACAGESSTGVSAGCVVRTEVCDGADDDCDGEVDEDAADAVPFYVDADGDGYGDTSTMTWACGGDTMTPGDCDDGDASANPGAAEVWYDGVDEDCDGWPDDDQDHDGFAVDVDCDDTDQAVHPGNGC